MFEQIASIPPYFWAKSLHIIAVICWFAMLFYLPRLFVYHAMAEDEISKERFKIMERKLLRGIGTPAMIVTLFSGGWTASAFFSGSPPQTWFWIKLALVAILVVYHFQCAKYMKMFQRDESPKNHVFFRWFNEFPVILLIVIVLLVVIKLPS